ncbi:MAG: PAS domain S-box protein [Gemmatimonadetes bacterium]|nr:PAS domain S-box protein [Gemmatimonadota bacterium]MYD13037.1 PAS domain S-box protein [Gemmatimonadota bacterium]MYI66671.1 PAS domain S-box protein [Gemmatimonadota bacterium]
MLTDRQYRTVFEASPDATLIVDAGGVIRDLNPQAARMFGWPAEEMKGLAVERLVPQEIRDEHLRHRRHYGEAPKPRPMGQGLELSAVRKDGTAFPVEISLSPSGLDGDEGWVICTVRDISGWKRMRRLSRMMVGAAELERKHLSRELHDDLLQYLVSLKIRAKLLADELDPGKRAEAWSLMSAEIHDAMGRVKRIITGLLPPELERRGLSSALRAVFRDAADVYGFTVHSSLERLDDELDGDIALGLYRIVQEAVTNAARHSQVNEATVAVTRCRGRVIAEVHDEGCGFELPGPGIEPIDGRVGLAGMRDRAALIGGEVTVWTAPGEGTTVRATLPFARVRPESGP